MSTLHCNLKVTTRPERVVKFTFDALFKLNMPVSVL